ncbi:MAG: RNA polymerase sigma factor [Proteobacteria bacterium]|nr:RNA polymerase sigma factor [Pseudomonadota bacterium]
MTKKRDTEHGSRYNSDLELAQAAASGDQVARRIVVERLYDHVRTAVRYLSADHRDQDDWVQLTLLTILRAIGTFRGMSSLEAWANRITLRTAMRLIKQQQKRERAIAPSMDFQLGTDWNSKNVHQRIAIRQHLARHLGALSPDRRIAVILRLVYGHSIDEIVELTGVPRNTVRQRLRRGRRQLRNKIAKDPFFSEWAQSRMS